MPARISAWAVYDVFDVKDGEKIFVGVVSDSQWRTFCEAFDLGDWSEDATLAANNDRVARRDVLLPRIRQIFAAYNKGQLMEKLENTGLPFAPISKPEDLLSDPHLNDSGGLLSMKIPGNGEIALPALPVSLDGARPGLSRDPPEIGAHSRNVLLGLGLTTDDIDRLIADGIVNCRKAD